MSSPELVNWDISNPSGWNLTDTNFTFEDGKLKVNGTKTGYLAKYNVFQLGNTYDIEIKVSNYSGNGSGFGVYDGNYAPIIVRTNGVYKYRLRANINTSMLIYAYVNSLGTIDYISIKKISNDTFM